MLGLHHWLLSFVLPQIVNFETWMYLLCTTVATGISVPSEVSVHSE